MPIMFNGQVINPRIPSAPHPHTGSRPPGIVQRGLGADGHYSVEIVSPREQLTVWSVSRRVLAPSSWSRGQPRRAARELPVAAGGTGDRRSHRPGGLAGQVDSYAGRSPLQAEVDEDAIALSVRVPVSRCDWVCSTRAVRRWRGR